MRKLRPKEKRDSRNYLFLPSSLKGKDHAWSTVLSQCCGEQRIPGHSLHSLLSQPVGGNSLRPPDKASWSPSIIGTSNWSHLSWAGREESCQEGTSTGPQKGQARPSGLRGATVNPGSLSLLPSAEAASVCHVPGLILLQMKLSSDLQKKPFYLENIPCSPYLERGQFDGQLAGL